LAELDPAASAHTRLVDSLPLSQRELEVLDLIKDGMTNRSAAFRLGISERTVREHVARIFLKLGVTSRVKAAVIAAEWEMHHRSDILKVARTTNENHSDSDAQAAG
jgi:DNA-binding NarL/FixJ family response regulator